jgi:hypothetical protein
MPDAAPGSSIGAAWECQSQITQRQTNVSQVCVGLTNWGDHVGVLWDQEMWEKYMDMMGWKRCIVEGVMNIKPTALPHKCAQNGQGTLTYKEYTTALRALPLLGHSTNTSKRCTVTHFHQKNPPVFSYSLQWCSNVVFWFIKNS